MKRSSNRILTTHVGSLIRPQALQEFLRAKGVAKPYWPEQVSVLEAFPRTASGKVQKFRLRDQVRDLP